VSRESRSANVHRPALIRERDLCQHRENARIQIFDRNGRFLQKWSLGHPFGLVIAPDHILYIGDAIAGRILKIDPQGRVLGSFAGWRTRPGASLGSSPNLRSHLMVRYSRLKLRLAC
jgi:hypothetical protein